MDVEQIEPMDIDTLLNALTDRSPNTGRPASRQTLVDIHSTTNRIFKYGMDLELITQNSARDREASRYAPRRYRRALAATEQGLITSTPHRTRVGALIIVLAGLRRGKLIPLAWNDIGPDGLKINVTKSAGNHNSNRLIIKAGTKASWGRVVNITLDLAFRLQKAEAVTWSKYVCPRTDDRMHALVSWWRIWDSYITALCRAPGAEQTSAQEITTHYLRCTYVTLLYLSGVDVLAATKLLSHSNVKTTISIYTHLDDLMLSKSVNKLDSYLSSSLFSSYVRGSV